MGREPTFTAAYLNLGRLYQENSRPDPQAAQKAQDVYRRVLDYEPNNSEANYQISLLLLQEGEYQNSLNRFSVFLKICKAMRSSYRSLALITPRWVTAGEQIARPRGCSPA